MNKLERLAAVVRQQTVGYRKGEIVTTTEVSDDLTVVVVDAFPATPDRGRLVDVHFLNVGFTEAAADRQAFVDAFEAAIAGDGQGEYVALNLKAFQSGPSYIAIGGWIGDQSLALHLMALVEFHGLGKVITPATLGVEGDAADALAGNGYVMCLLNKAQVPA